MPHCTPEQLALAALGEPLPAEDAAHLASCAPLPAEVASLRRSVDALAVPQLAAPGAAVPPPPARLGRHRRGHRACSADAAVSRTRRRKPPTQTPTVLPFRSRRRPLLLLVAASVVVGAVVGAGAVARAARRRPARTSRAAETAAARPAGRNEASGDGRGRRPQRTARARWRSGWTRPTVRRRLLRGLADRASTHRAWSRSASPARARPTFELPAGLDLDAFPIVDVSRRAAGRQSAHTRPSRSPAASWRADAARLRVRR